MSASADRKVQAASLYAVCFNVRVLQRDNQMAAAKQWVDDDIGYENWLSAHQSGFMANMSKRPHSNYFVIHRSTHKLPDRSNPATRNPRTGNRYSKVTAETLTELVDWARRTVPALHHLSAQNFCDVCAPADALPVESPPTASPEEYITGADRIRACGTVKKPMGVVVPRSSTGTSTVFFRDPSVRAWVLQRAVGHCELCGNPAPFLTDDQEPFLESHHLITLSAGGPDTPDNAAAVCPNCHRNLHHGIDRDDLRERLSRTVVQKEAPR